MSWVDDSIKAYYTFLKDKTSCHTDDKTNWSVISTPFYGTYNDPIDIYVKQDERGNILISDDGITLTNLAQVGVSFSHSAKRKEWLNAILCNYGIVLENNELKTKASGIEDFAQKKHDMICAIFAISEMELMAKNTVSTMFNEDVRNMLNERGVVYTPEFIAKGKTGIEFTFDFQLAGQKEEKVIKSFNVLNKMNVPNFLFSYDDIKEGRERISGKKLNSVAIINDTNKDLKEDLISAFEAKSVPYILWSQRGTQENMQKLKVS